ncbi:MAG: hypothetical protein P8103_05920 [Candidatus Thiodiazotropha sp.]
MKGLTPAFLAALMFFLHGCGGSSSTTTPPVSTPGNTQPTELEGSWRKACSPADPLDPDTHYDIITLTFVGDEFFSDIENYDDSGCTIPLAISPNPTASGTFVLGDLITATDGTEAREIDTHIDTYDGAPFIIDDYVIYRIDADTLYLADESGSYDGSIPQLRPQTLDYTRPYIRQ